MVSGWTGCSGSSGSSGSDHSSFMMASDDKSAEVERSEGSASRRMWPKRVAKFLSSCSGSLGNTGNPSAHCTHSEMQL